MLAQFRSELVKLHSTRTVPTLLLGLVALLLFVVILHGATQDGAALGSGEAQRDLFATGWLGALFAAYLGAMVVTSEFRHGTIRPTLLVSPVRERVIVAKLAVGVCAGALLGLASALLGFATGWGLLEARGIGLELGVGAAARLVGGAAAMAALWGPLGVALGACVRNQVGAIVGLSVWVLVIESLLTESAPSVGRFTPTGAGEALSGAELGMLSPLAGGLLLAGYVAAIAAAALVTTGRRDVG